MLNILLAASTLFNYIQVPTSNIHDQPDADSNVISEVCFSEEITILDRFDDWLLIETSSSNHMGWIQKAAVAKRVYQDPSVYSASFSSDERSDVLFDFPELWQWQGFTDAPLDQLKEDDLVFLGQAYDKVGLSNEVTNKAHVYNSFDPFNADENPQEITDVIRAKDEEFECSFIYYFINNEKMPLVISPTDSNLSLESFQQWVESHQNELKSLLSTHGALLLRDFPINDAHAFSIIVKAALGTPMNYKGGEGSRTKVVDGVYTSTEAPPKHQIFLHNELSCTDSPPSYICFYCDTPPQPGSGQTLLGRTETVTQAIKKRPDVWNLFEGQTMKYISRHPPKGSFFNTLNNTHKTWQEAFETDDKQEVERICKEKGFEFKWIGDWIEVTRRATATKSPDNHFDFTYWFNQIHLYHLNPRNCGGWLTYLLASIVYARPSTRQYDIEFEDRSSIPRDIVYQIYDTLNENTIKFDWKKQDLLLLDNVKALHGKAPYEGPRRILVSMVP